ncbi:MAG: hypothetical protein R2799_03630 [Crocinitomicaceae bacterium]
MKKIFDIESSKIGNEHMNKIRGGASGSGTTCKKDENSDSDGDGVADDCTYVVDDPGIKIPSPILT